MTSLTEGLDEAPAQSPRSEGDRGGAGAAKWQTIKITAVAIMLVAASILFVMFSGIFGGNGLAESTRLRTLIDSDTGEVFVDYRIPAADNAPYPNPHTGDRTLFPAETCFWTADGGAKTEPTYVLLNEYAGIAGPTRCPDCGRPVRSHNPLPPRELLEKAVAGETGGS